MDIIGRTGNVAKIFNKLCTWWRKAHTEHREMASIIYREKQVFERLYYLFKRLRVPSNPDILVIDKYLLALQKAIKRDYFL